MDVQNMGNSYKEVKEFKKKGKKSSPVVEKRLTLHKKHNPT